MWNFIIIPNFQYKENTPLLIFVYRHTHKVPTILLKGSRAALSSNKWNRDILCLHEIRLYNLWSSKKKMNGNLFASMNKIFFGCTGQKIFFPLLLFSFCCNGVRLSPSLQAQNEVFCQNAPFCG